MKKPRYSDNQIMAINKQAEAGITTSRKLMRLLKNKYLKK